MLRAYKTELDPNNKQKTMFIRYCGTARFVFNWALSDRKEKYEAGSPVSMYEQKKRFNSIKDSQFPWIREIPYRVMESAFMNCDLAYKNFFRRVKSGDTKSGFPKFKSRKRGLGSFTLRDGIVVSSKSVRLTKIGQVRLKESCYIPDDVKVLSATISERAGHWFISVQVDDGKKPMDVNVNGKVIGVDLGIKVLATCSDGTVFNNPKSLVTYERRLSHISRELSRRQKGSENRRKTKIKVAKLHHRIANIRKYALHQVSNYLTVKAKPETIVIEDLNVSGMLKNNHLSKAIADASFAELRRQIEYKSSWYGVNLIVADRFYPSSKTCSACGVKKPLLRLSDRTFVCESCGAVIDRDYNASVNLEKLAQ